MEYYVDGNTMETGRYLKKSEKKNNKKFAG